jgi:hypothetical protein
MSAGAGGSCAVLAAVALALGATAANAAPDLSGVWQITAHVGAAKTTDGGSPPLTADARAVYDAHRKAAAQRDFSFDGTTRCLPPGLPRLMLMHEPFEILQRDKIVYFVYQVNRLPRRAYLNEALPTDVDPHYLGYSVAHWDADALVVESAGFDDSTVLDNVGLPHSEDLHLTERYQLSTDGRHLRLTYTVEDPKTFTKAWSGQAEYARLPHYQIPEEVCAATPVAKRPRD